MSRRLLGITTISAFSLWLIVVTGAAVRLTGSGLGCESWPGCEEGAFFPAEGHHAVIEFTNRAIAIFPLTATLLAWIAAARTPGFPRFATWLAAVTFLGTIAQAPLGRVTIMLDLHPLMVMAHFLLALLVLATAAIVALEAWSHRRGCAASPVPPAGRWAGALVVLAGAVLVVTGSFATAAGPHPGSDEDVRRFGNLVDAMWMHVRATAVFGIAFLVLLAFLWRRRDEAGLLLPAAVGLLALLLVQMAIGELQWRNQLPWGLVLVHVGVAGLLWAWLVGLGHAVWRPPAPLLAHRMGAWPASSVSPSARSSGARS